jgi:hypothetical protein
MGGCSACSTPTTTTDSPGVLRVTQSPDPAIAQEPVTISFDGSYFATDTLFADRCPRNINSLQLGDGRLLSVTFNNLQFSGPVQAIGGRQRCVLAGTGIQAVYPAGTPGTTRTVQNSVELRREDAHEHLVAGDHAHVIRIVGDFPVRVRTPETPRPPTPPVALIQRSGSLSRGSNLLLDGRGSNDVDGRIVSYSWDLDLRPGDVASDSHDGAFETVSYRTAGPRTVTLTVTDDDGQTDTESDTFTIRDDEGGCTYMCRAVAAGRRSARLTPVRLRLVSDVVSRGRLSAGILGRRAEGVIVRGRMTGRLARRARVPAALFDLYRSTFAGRFDFDQVVGRPDAPLVGTGTILARSRRDRSTQVCLRVTGDGRRENLGRNRFRVVGGTGDARRLRATGSFPLPREANVRGRFAVRAYNGRVRGLPRDCRALRRLLPRRR